MVYLDIFYKILILNFQVVVQVFFSGFGVFGGGGLSVGVSLKDEVFNRV